MVSKHRRRITHAVMGIIAVGAFFAMGAYYSCNETTAEVAEVDGCDIGSPGCIAGSAGARRCKYDLLNNHTYIEEGPPPLSVQGDRYIFTARTETDWCYRNNRITSRYTDPYRKVYDIGGNLQWSFGPAGFTYSVCLTDYYSCETRWQSRFENPILTDRVVCVQTYIFGRTGPANHYRRIYETGGCPTAAATEASHTAADAASRSTYRQAGHTAALTVADRAVRVVGRSGVNRLTSACRNGATHRCVKVFKRQWGALSQAEQAELKRLMKERSK